MDSLSISYFSSFLAESDIILEKPLIMSSSFPVSSVPYFFAVSKSNLFITCRNCSATDLGLSDPMQEINKEKTKRKKKRSLDFIERIMRFNIYKHTPAGYADSGTSHRIRHRWFLKSAT